MIEQLYQIAVIVIAVLAALVTVLKFFSLSSSAINWWSSLFEKFAFNRKNKYLKKKAIQFKIEGIVNTTVYELQKELPANWVKKMHIQWVDQGSIKKLKRGQSIIRIEPDDRQDYNIINGIYNYFNNCLFPTTFEVVPDRIVNSLSVRLSQRTIENSDRKEYLLEKFNRTILEREIQRDLELLKFFEPFSELDTRGFLTGALVREIDAIAEKVRVKEIRSEFEIIVLETIEHMRSFTKRLKGGKEAVSEEEGEMEWDFSGKVHKYRFLLARRQGKMKVDAHLKRALEAYETNVDRLYVFGANKDIPFTSKLITRISNKTDFRHVETFDLDRDFHSNKHGIGALFVRN